MELFAALYVSYLKLEGAMRKAISHAAVLQAADDTQDFVSWWATAMWCAAAVFLLATFQPF